MNIEKSIEILKEFKKTGFHTLMIKYNEDRIHTNKIIEDAIETLLTAYEKEKEKNKRYEKYLKSKDKQHEQVLEYLETEKENEYISKEKIKERIKEYYEYDKRMQNKPDWHTTKYYEAKALEKLLEE